MAQTKPCRRAEISLHALLPFSGPPDKTHRDLGNFLGNGDVSAYIAGTILDRGHCLGYTATYIGNRGVNVLNTAADRSSYAINVVEYLWDSITRFLHTLLHASRYLSGIAGYRPQGLFVVGDNLVCNGEDI